MGGKPSNRRGTGLPVLSKNPVGQEIESIYTSRLRQFTDSGMHSEHIAYFELI